MKLPYYDGHHVFIDSHGSDHGLFIGFDSTFRTVRIRDYSEFCEPNAETGRWESVLREIDVDIDELFDVSAPHLTGSGDGESALSETGAERFVSVALAYLAYWGAGSDGTTIIELPDGDDDARCVPAEHFAEFHHRDLREPETRMRCEQCERESAERLRDAVCRYAYPEPESEIETEYRERMQALARKYPENAERFPALRKYL